MATVDIARLLLLRLVHQASNSLKNSRFLFLCFCPKFQREEGNSLAAREIGLARGENGFSLAGNACYAGYRQRGPRTDFQVFGQFSEHKRIQ